MKQFRFGLDTVLDYKMQTLEHLKTEHAAIIGAVAVLPEYQRQGIGTSIVQSLLHRCMEKYQKHIYVYCNSKENALFYRTMGFTDSGVWAESEQI